MPKVTQHVLAGLGLSLGFCESDIVSSNRIDACQAPDRLMEEGHRSRGWEQIWGLFRVCQCPILRWRDGEQENRHQFWVRECFVCTVAHRVVIIIRNKGGPVPRQGLRLSGPRTQGDRLSVKSPFPKIPSLRPLSPEWPVRWGEKRGG